MHVRILRPAFCLVSMALASIVFAAGDGAGAPLERAAKLHLAGDNVAAIALWRSLAASGDIDAAYNLGTVYYHADGVARDYGEAMKWYRVAAERGDWPSQMQLGFMYLNGEGVAADAATADRWFTRHVRERAQHAHNPQMEAWRRQALAMIEERDRREAYRLSQRDSDKVLADLRRRAAITAPNSGVSSLAGADAMPAAVP